MSDSDATPWKIFTAIAALAAVILGFMWYRAGQGTVPVSVADSLRQETTRLSSTVEKLRAAPPETVYAAPPDERQNRARLSERIQGQLDELEAVLPSAESHPAYHRTLQSIRSALDTISDS